MQCGAKVTITDVSGGISEKVIEGVTQISISKRRNAPTQFSMIISNKEGFYTPYASSGEWVGMLQTDIYNSVGGINKYIKIYLYSDDAEWESPPLLPLTRRISNSGDGYSMSIEGIDLLHMLIKRNQSLASYESTTNSNLIRCSRIVRDVLIAYKYPSFDISNLENSDDDYPILEYDVQDMVPLDVIRELFIVNNWDFYIESDGTFRVRKPEIKSSPDWPDFETGNNVFFMEETESVLGLINEIRINKVTKYKNLYEQTYTEPGRYSIELSNSLLNPIWIDLSTPGYPSAFIHSVDYFNEEGEWARHYHAPQTPYSLNAPTGSANSRIKTVYFTCYWGGNSMTTYPSSPDGNGGVIYQPGLSGGEIQGGAYQAGDGDSPWAGSLWKIRIVGTPALDITTDYAFNTVIRDQSSIDKYGVWPSDSFDTTLVPTQAWAEAMARRILNEAARLQYTVKYTFPFLPLLDIGETVRIKDDINNINSLYYVEEVDLEFDSGDVTANGTLSLYPGGT